MKVGFLIVIILVLGLVVGMLFAINNKVDSLRYDYDYEKAKYCREHHYTKVVEGTNIIYTEKNCK